MSARHTPGPWRVVVNAVHGKAEKVVGRDGSAVAFPCWGDGQGRRPAEKVNADALLVAAAPDLLKALAGLRAWVAQLEDDGDLDDRKNAADDAIARATGEEAPYG